METLRGFLMESVLPAENLSEARENFISALGKIREDYPGITICYVIGKITSDGPEHIEKNLELLKDRTKKIYDVLRASHGIAFSAANLFTPALFERFDAAGAKNQDYLDFWEAVIRSGHITEIYTTPGWDSSVRANHENKVATEMELPVRGYEDLVKE